MNYYIPMHSSPPINWSREMGEAQNQEAIRVMGYRFESPTARGLIIRRATPAEMQARDRRIDLLRGERSAMRSAYAAFHCTDAMFAAARVNAVAALARCARLRKGSGRKVWQRKDGAE